jgi:hypothetical protein
MDATGDLVMAWMLLWRAATAAPKTSDKKSGTFYDGQIKSARHFIRTVLPVTLGKLEAIRNCDDAGITMDEDAFAG